MPIADFIGEVILRGVLEAIIYTVTYYTGAITLWILTLGQIRMAPLSSIESTNQGKNRWTDWSIWLYQGRQTRTLKAEWVCATGILLWVAIGVGLYFGLRGDQDNSEQPSGAKYHNHFDLERPVAFDVAAPPSSLLPRHLV